MTPVRKKTDTPQGVLHRKEGEKKFQLLRFSPSAEMDFFVEHYWAVQWSLDENEAPYHQEILPAPSVNVTFENQNTQVYGVVKRKFSYELKGHGDILAVKFHPGGFYPFVQTSMSTLTNRVVPWKTLFHEENLLVPWDVFTTMPAQEKVQQIESLLSQYQPPRDKNVLCVREIIDEIREVPEIFRVEDIVHRAGVGKRFLQRLFKEYVGVNPKWVIRIYRLQEAAERMVDHELPSWAQLAIDLGYSDQAHFIRDFKAVVGQSPTAYRSQLQQMGLHTRDSR